MTDFLVPHPCAVCCTKRRKRCKYQCFVHGRNMNDVLIPTHPPPPTHSPHPKTTATSHKKVPKLAFYPGPLTAACATTTPPPPQTPKKTKETKYKTKTTKNQKPKHQNFVRLVPQVRVVVSHFLFFGFMYVFLFLERLCRGDSGPVSPKPQEPKSKLGE